MDKECVIVSAVRTAVGRFGGSLKNHSASDLGAIVIREAVHRAGIESTAVDEVVMGCVGQFAEDAYIARTCAVKAGLPVEIPALSVNRMCASGLESVVLAALRIRSGETEIAVAGGTESMSNYPFFVRKARFGYQLGHGSLEDGILTVLHDPVSRMHMGVTAENVSHKYGISRERQDTFALESQRRMASAVAAGVFEDEIILIEVKFKKRAPVQFRQDEHFRTDTSLEKLAALTPAFEDEGTVTAGNASGINDGAAAMVVMSRRKCEQLGLEPLARMVGSAVRGVEPQIMGTGPIPAVRKLLETTGIPMEQIDIIELNEAFAAQSLACIDELNLDPQRVNPWGGAIAMGHPVGATGSILTVKLLHALKREEKRLGLVTLCVGGGQGIAALFER